MSEKQRAVVTGASSGIGAATVRQLRALDWDVVAVARREDRLRQLADATGASYVVADVTSDDDVARLAGQITATGPLHALVNNAGVAVRADRIADAAVADWARMYDVNVLGTVRVTHALLPALRASRGDVVLMGSTAGLVGYEGGGGYSAAKHGVHAFAGTLRLEEAENDLRVIEIAPGMVRTDEFSLNRFEGDRTASDAVYAGVAAPLTADDVATAVTWSLALPHHMNVDLMVLRPVAQAAQHKVIRRS